MKADVSGVHDLIRAHPHFDEVVRGVAMNKLCRMIQANLIP